MIRDLLRRALRRAFKGPRVPSEPSTGRAPPTDRGAWRAPSSASPPAAPAAHRSEPEPDPEAEVLVEISAADVLALEAKGERPLLLDIREPHELRGGYAEGSLIIPMNSLPERVHELPTDRPLIVVCAAGARSFSVAHYLREQGFPQAWSLEEGVGSYLRLTQRTLFWKDGPPPISAPSATGHRPSR
jgi:rhodanese-related sulfurtransferase